MSTQIPPMALAEADVMSEVYDLLVYVTSLDNIFRGNQSREVLPADGDFIIYTPLFRERIGTNVVTFNAENCEDDENGTYTDAALVSLDIQVDFFGENASKLAQTLNVFIHSITCYNWLVANNYGIRVAKCTDPQQIDLIDDTRQFSKRWMVTISVEFSSDVIQAPVEGVGGGVPWFEDVVFKGNAVDPSGDPTPASKAGVIDVDVFFKP